MYGEPMNAKKGLNKKIILDAAQKVIKEDGFNKLSFRKIATKAGCATMSIYQYFSSKDILLAALLDQRVADGCPLPAHNTNHQSWLADIFYSMYQELIKEPDFILLFANSSYSGPASLKMVNAIFKKLIDDVGLTADAASFVFHHVLTFVNGAALIAASNQPKKFLPESYINTVSDQLDWQHDVNYITKTVDAYGGYMHGKHVQRQLTSLLETLVKQVKQNKTACPTLASVKANELELG